MGTPGAARQQQTHPDSARALIESFHALSSLPLVFEQDGCRNRFQM